MRVGWVGGGNWRALSFPQLAFHPPHPSHPGSRCPNGRGGQCRGTLALEEAQGFAFSERQLASRTPASGRGWGAGRGAREPDYPWTRPNPASGSGRRAGGPAKAADLRTLRGCFPLPVRFPTCVSRGAPGVLGAAPGPGRRGGRRLPGLWMARSRGEGPPPASVRRAVPARTAGGGPSLPPLVAPGGTPRHPAAPARRPGNTRPNPAGRPRLRGHPAAPCVTRRGASGPDPNKGPAAPGGTPRHPAAPDGTWRGDSLGPGGTSRPHAHNLAGANPVSA